MDLISRQAAIDRINKQREHLQPDIYPQDKIGDAAYRICAEFIERLPSAQPECTECEEYDHKTKSCPYYCEVVRKTAHELQVEASCKLPERKTGRWMATEADEPCFYRCSECGRLIDERENYCPNCGARLEGGVNGF